MNNSVPLEIRDDFAIARLCGIVSLNEAVRLIADALATAREEKVHRLLVDASNLSGFEPPTVVDRFYIIREWAEVARGFAGLALVVKAEMIDPQKFGVTVGLNAGLNSNVFASESEAIAWLLKQEPA